MKRLILILGILAILGFLFWKSRQSEDDSSLLTPQVIAQADLESPEDESKNSPVSPFFDQYGSDQQTPEQDLENVATSLEHLWLLLKNRDAISVMSNQSITSTLLGENPHKLRLIAKGHPALNEKNELTDRWSTPLHFHPEKLTQIEIRSAGPDKKLFTADDFTHIARGK